MNLYFESGQTQECSISIGMVVGYEFPSFTLNKSAFTSIIAYTGLAKSFGTCIQGELF